MKKINIFSLLLAILFMAGCDYNDKYFDGFDDIEISDLVNYEGEYTGKYTDGNYFLVKDSVESRVNTMLKGMFLYCDEGSTAKVSVNFGTLLPGFENMKYVLLAEDYDSMGEESGQPGKYNNFDSQMDVDAYLTAFCDAKFPDAANWSTVSIVYNYYREDKPRTSTYEKGRAGWTPYNFVKKEYTLVPEDYRLMDRKYDDFNGEVDAIFTAFLKLKFPFAAKWSAYSLTYNYFSGGVTAPKTSTYWFDGADWSVFDPQVSPYVQDVEVNTVIADMKYDGRNWELLRLLGGTERYTFAAADYKLLTDWVNANKPEYMKDATNEFYFGASSNYGNINNQYSNWKGFDPNNEYQIADKDLQVLMNERLSEGIGSIVLAEKYPTPDTGLVYEVTYKIYQGATSDYLMSFMYNEEKGKYELVSGPDKK